MEVLGIEISWDVIFFYGIVIAVLIGLSFSALRPQRAEWEIERDILSCISEKEWVLPSLIWSRYRGNHRFVDLSREAFDKKLRKFHREGRISCELRDLEPGDIPLHDERRALVGGRALMYRRSSYLVS